MTHQQLRDWFNQRMQWTTLAVKGVQVIEGVPAEITQRDLIYHFMHVKLHAPLAFAEDFITRSVRGNSEVFIFYPFRAE